MDEATGEILLEANDEITAEKVEVLKKAGLETLEVFIIPQQDEADVVRNTLRKDSDQDAGGGARTASTTCSVRASRRAPTRPARS